MRPVFEFRLGQNDFEELESRVFQIVTLHVEIDKFAQHIHREADVFFPPLAQCRYNVMGSSSGNELASCLRNIPSQERRAYPWHEARHANAKANERVETIVAIAEVFFEMPNNFA